GCLVFEESADLVKSEIARNAIAYDRANDVLDRVLVRFLLWIVISFVVRTECCPNLIMQEVGRAGGRADNEIDVVGIVVTRVVESENRPLCNLKPLCWRVIAVRDCVVAWLIEPIVLSLPSGFQHSVTIESRFSSPCRST